MLRRLMTGKFPVYTVLVLTSLLALTLLSLYILSLEKPVDMVYGSRQSGDWNNKVLENTIRVGTYNINGGENLEDENNLDQIASMFRESNLDFIGLNEVRSVFFEKANQVEQLGNELDMEWIFAPTRKKYLTKGFGNAVLSNTAISKYYIHPLVNEMVEEDAKFYADSRRNMIIATISMNDKPVTVIVTHLDRSKLHDEQLKQVLEQLTTSYPAILIGDLNAMPGNPIIEKGIRQNDFQDALSDYNEADPERLDWILTRGFRTVNTGKYPTGVSDHPHYWAELALE